MSVFGFAIVIYLALSWGKDWLEDTFGEFDPEEEI